MGLFGSICILIVVSLLGGRPGMVSACTAGVALLMGGLMQAHGLSYLLAASILAGILFSRKVAKVIAVSASWRTDDWLHYRVRGQLFFVSRVYFQAGFKHHEHPTRVTIDMAEAHIWDQTGMRALDQVVRKLRQGGSTVELLNLNAESPDLFRRISESSDALVRS